MARVGQIIVAPIPGQTTVLSFIPTLNSIIQSWTAYFIIFGQSEPLLA